MLLGVGGRDLDTDTSLTLGDDGIAEANDVDTLLEHHISELAGKSGVTEHDGGNRMIVVTSKSEAGGGHSITEVVGVLADSLRKLRGVHEHIEGGDTGTDESGRKGVGEEVRSGLVSEESNDLLGSAGVTTRTASHGLAEGGGQEVNTTLGTSVLGGTTTGGTKVTSGVGLIDPDEGVVLVSEVADLLEGSDITIHGEDTIGDDDSVSLVLAALELLLKIGHVHVQVSQSLSLAETNTIDDGGVVELIGDDGVLGVEEALEETSVGIEARGVEDAVLEAVELGDLALELLVEVGGTADETDGGEAETVGIEGLLGGLDEDGAVGETEVVVGAEVDDLAVSSLDFDLGELLGGDDTLILVGAGGLDVLELLGDELVELLAVSGRNDFLNGFHWDVVNKKNYGKELKTKDSASVIHTHQQTLHILCWVPISWNLPGKGEGKGTIGVDLAD